MLTSTVPAPVLAWLLETPAGGMGAVLHTGWTLLLFKIILKFHIFDLRTLRELFMQKNQIFWINFDKVRGGQKVRKPKYTMVRGAAGFKSFIVLTANENKIIFLKGKDLLTA